MCVLGGCFCPCTGRSRWWFKTTQGQQLQLPARSAHVVTTWLGWCPLTPQSKMTAAAAHCQTLFLVLASGKPLISFLSLCGFTYFCLKIFWKQAHDERLCNILQKTCHSKIRILKFNTRCVWWYNTVSRKKHKAKCQPLLMKMLMTITKKKWTCHHRYQGWS